MLTLTRPDCYPHPDCPDCRGNCTDATGATCPTCEGYGAVMCAPCRAYADAMIEAQVLTESWPAERRIAWTLDYVLGRQGRH